MNQPELTALCNDLEINKLTNRKLMKEILMEHEMRLAMARSGAHHEFTSALFHESEIQVHL